MCGYLTIQMFIVEFDIYTFMSQQEVYDFLKKHPNGWFTSREISNWIKISCGSVTNCLKRLRNRDEIQYKQTGKRIGKRGQYLYKFKK